MATYKERLHDREMNAYEHVMKTFRCQSDSLSWSKYDILSKLKSSLNISNEYHDHLTENLEEDEGVKEIWALRERDEDPTMEPREREFSNELGKAPKRDSSGPDSIRPTKVPRSSSNEVKQKNTSSLEPIRVPTSYCEEPRPHTLPSSSAQNVSLTRRKQESQGAFKVPSNRVVQSQGASKVLSNRAVQSQGALKVSSNHVVCTSGNEDHLSIETKHHSHGLPPLPYTTISSRRGNPLGTMVETKARGKRVSLSPSDARVETQSSRGEISSSANEGIQAMKPSSSSAGTLTTKPRTIATSFAGPERTRRSVINLAKGVETKGQSHSPPPPSKTSKQLRVDFMLRKLEDTLKNETDPGKLVGLLEFVKRELDSLEGEADPGKLLRIKELMLNLEEKIQKSLSELIDLFGDSDVEDEDENVADISHEVEEPIESLKNVKESEGELGKSLKKNEHVKESEQDEESDNDNSGSRENSDSKDSESSESSDSSDSESSDSSDSSDSDESVDDKDEDKDVIID